MWRVLTWRRRCAALGCASKWCGSTMLCCAVLSCAVASAEGGRVSLLGPMCFPLWQLCCNACSDTPAPPCRASPCPAAMSCQVADFRRQLGVRVSGFDAPKPVKLFSQASLASRREGGADKVVAQRIWKVAVQGLGWGIPIAASWCQLVPVVLCQLALLKGWLACHESLRSSHRPCACTSLF